MEEITKGRSAFKEAWAALPKERRRAISKAVQSGREVPEETAVAIGYANAQIRISWLGYLGVLVLVFVINKIQGEDLVSSPLTWVVAAAIVLLGGWAYKQLFRSRAANQTLLAERAEANDEEAIARLQDEGGPVTEVPEPHPHEHPVPPSPSAPAEPGQGPPTPSAQAEPGLGPAGE